MGLAALKRMVIAPGGQHRYGRTRIILVMLVVIRGRQGYRCCDERPGAWSGTLAVASFPSAAVQS
jgi:hypothetical protein